MATTLNFKPILDKPEWRPVATPQAGLTTLGSGTIGGGSVVSDFRSNNYNIPSIWYMGVSGPGSHLQYNAVTDGWFGLYNANWNPTGASNTGIVSAFAPSQGPRGEILAGSTASILNLDTNYYAPVAATWTRSGTAVTVATTRPHNFYINQKVFVSASSDVTAIPVSSLSSSNSINNVGSAFQFNITGLNAGAVSGTLTVGVPICADQWADRGDSLGFMIRVIGLASGKIEERRIISNTGYSGPTSLYVSAPTIYLDQPLSFTPAAGDRFELLSGACFQGSTGVALGGQWRSLDVSMAVNADSLCAYSGSRGVTNLNLGANAQGGIIVFDEQHVPADKIPGEGFITGASTYDTATLSGTNYINTKKCLLATAIAAGTITGQASNGDSIVVANEYRNFQIRIVEDTVNTTAVGQRRRISSHTAGPSAVYTLSANWTVTPSANCKFVIENWTDNILVTGGTSTSMMTYKVSNLCADTSQTIDTWSTTQFTNTNGPAQYGVLVHCFGAKRNNSANSSIRNSFIYSMSNSILYTFDVAGGTNGAWAASNMNRTIANFGTTSTTLLISYAYDPFTCEGDAVYMWSAGVSNASQINHQIFKLSLIKGTITAYTPIKSPYGYLSGTSWTTSVGSSVNKMGVICYQDGTTKITAIYSPAYGRPTNAPLNEFFELLISA